ncbi:MAG: glycosyltransferase family 39 protein [Clostridium sp.]
MIRSFKFTKDRLALLLIIILSAILNFWNLGIEGFGNEFYAAGVKSMLTSGKNFFFLSFDPTGYITMDKPPIGLWIQGLFAKIFGFHGWSIILPQAIAGVLSVILLYYLMKKYFSIWVGLVSALALAITPVVVAASRNNTIDNLLLLTTLIASYFAIKSATTGKLKYLIICVIWMAIGFNIKMVEAFLILPAVYFVYFLSNKLSLKRKILNLILGSLILIILSLSWGFIVDMVPAKDRPFVGSSTDNSVIELMIGHNGLQRLGVYSKLNGGSFLPSQMIKNNTSLAQTVVDEKGNAAPVSNHGRGIMRLLSPNSMSDQIIWFIPFALLGILVGLIKEKNIFKFTNKRKVALLYLLSWFIPDFIYFSFSGGIAHTYYLTILAAPIAALASIGIIYSGKLYTESKKKSVFLGLGFLLTIFFQGRMLIYYNENLTETLKIISFGALLITFISIGIILLFRNIDSKFKKPLFIIGILGIMTVPLIGSGATLKYPLDGNAAEAGLQLLPDKNIQEVSPNALIEKNIPKLINYLEKHETGEKYLLVTPTSIDTSPYAEKIILQSKKSVMALGGFSGADNVVTLPQFKEMVKKGQIKYVLVQNITLSPNNQEIINWVKSTGTLVPRKDWENINNNDMNTNLYKVN